MVIFHGRRRSQGALHGSTHHRRASFYFSILIFAFLMTPHWLLAKDFARPESHGGDWLLEFTTELSFLYDVGEPGLGLDLEYFVPGTEHHFSVGLSTDVEFTKSFTQYFVGPLVSGYYRHFKVFWTSGVVSENFNRNLRKHRLGLGYEIIGDLIYVPSVSYDKVGNHEGISIIFGVAHEF